MQSYPAAVNQKNRKQSAANPELQERIRELIQFKGGGHNQAEVADIIENALKLLADVKDTGDVRVIQTALRELRYSFRLFAPYAGKRKVSIFGSARTQPYKFVYQQAADFGRKIVKAGFMVITGAGPGIMQAGHEGAGPVNSFGVNIRLPWEQTANPPPGGNAVAGRLKGRMEPASETKTFIRLPSGISPCHLCLVRTVVTER